MKNLLLSDKLLGGILTNIVQTGSRTLLLFSLLCVLVNIFLIENYFLKINYFTFSQQK